MLTRKGTSSQKLDAIRTNRQLWPQAIVCVEWLHACEQKGARLPLDSYGLQVRFSWYIQSITVLKTDKGLCRVRMLVSRWYLVKHHTGKSSLLVKPQPAMVLRDKQKTCSQVHACQDVSPAYPNTVSLQRPGSSRAATQSSPNPPSQQQDLSVLSSRTTRK